MQPEYQKLASLGSRILCSESFCSEHVEKLRELISIGRSHEQMAIGYHGTSFLALQIAMRTGHLPTGRSPGNEGHLYFFPLSAAGLTCEGFDSELEGEEADREGFENAQLYACDHTRAALFAQTLGLDLTCDKVWGLMSYISDRDDAERLREEDLKDFGLSKKTVAEGLDVYHRAIFRRKSDDEHGYILLLGRSALGAQPPLVGDRGYGDMKIKVDPPGLSIEHLVGVHPITPADRRLFQQILKLYGR
jgi:hypothetical protein